MVYTNNVPQKNETIASTTDRIRNNFAFLETSIGAEHNFNALGTGADTYHNQASMPNQVTPGALPAGTNGMFYVNNGVPKFFDGATDFNIQIAPTQQFIAFGTVNLTTSNTNIITLPAFSSGTYYLIPPAAIDPNNGSAMGQFVTGQTTMQVGTVSDPGISVSASGLTLRAQTLSSAQNGTYKYVIIRVTP